MEIFIPIYILIVFESWLVFFFRYKEEMPWYSSEVSCMEQCTAAHIWLLKIYAPHCPPKSVKDEEATL